MRTEVIQAAIRNLMRQVLFRAFALNMENGDRLLIERPENIAIDPGDNGSPPRSDFFVISRKVVFFGTFEAVTSVSPLDTSERIA